MKAVASVHPTGPAERGVRGSPLVAEGKEDGASALEDGPKRVMATTGAKRPSGASGAKSIKS